MADQNLTHDELWDDSALVTSWNDAFDEYKKYHSLAQRGEKVEVKQENDTKSSLPSKAAAHLRKNGTSNAPVNFVASNTNNTKPQASAPVPGPSIPAPPALPGLSSLPQALVGGAQNEDLKNIMMSWYYAGYYTGLYEGQQKAWASMQESMQPQPEGE
ncbi:putative SMN complex subunit Smn1 protein [Septoria linicola]|nr:putative SMN complex subunit Smn1 protein [Septoria linicola]